MTDDRNSHPSSASSHRRGYPRRQPGRRDREEASPHGEHRHRRSRDRGRSRTRGADGDDGLYVLDLLAGRHQDPLPMFDLLVDEDGRERIVPHVCSNSSEGYLIRVTNHSPRHIACAVTVDGENALLRDGSLIVAPRDSRKLPGFLVSKNFVGKEYVKEYRDFVFGKPKVIEGDSAITTGVGDVPYTIYGSIKCEVFEAVLDEEIDSDQELRGQTTFYRGAGLHGSFDERIIPEGKKKHFLYSSVTVQGSRSSISNSTRGRWWVRGSTRLRDLEVRYREAHSLMLLGVDPRVLGLASCKEEPGIKEEDREGEAKKEEGLDEKCPLRDSGLEPGTSLVEVCDLTADEAPRGQGAWTVQQRRRAEPVDIERSLGALC